MVPSGLDVGTYVRTYTTIELGDLEVPHGLSWGPIDLAVQLDHIPVGWKVEN